MTRRFPILPLLALALSLGLALGVPVPVSASDEPLSVSRDRVTITEDVVRLGDLFSNTGAKADTVVESAPAPGAEARYDVHRLAAIARAYGLTWRARSWSERVVIERPGQIIGTDQILGTLRHALAGRIAMEGPVDIELAQDDLSLTLPADRPATIAIESLRHNPNTGQFTAVVAAPAGDPKGLRLNVSGRTYSVIEVPTLNRRIMPGTVIARSDITWIRMRTNRVSRNVVTDADHLVGSTPTRPAVAGKMLMTGDVRAPRIVTKGSLVTLLLRTPNMVLTAKGRAMEDGARGDVIRVMNIQSKAMIEGEVTSAGTVLVTAASFMPGAPTANQSAANIPARR